MITKPQDGDLGLLDLGLLGGQRLVRAEGGIWWHTDGSGRSQTYVTPTGERAEPIEWLNDVEAVAAEMRAWAGGVAALRHVADWADRIDPPTPEPEPEPAPAPEPELDEKAKLLERVRNLERENLAYYKKLGYELTSEDIAQLTRTPLPEGDVPAELSADDALKSPHPRDFNYYKGRGQ